MQSFLTAATLLVLAVWAKDQVTISMTMPSALIQPAED